jgi:hypothetical protein
MPQTFEPVYQFFDNADAYAAFLRRTAVAVLTKASALRAESPPSPVSAAWVARQHWALQVLSSQAGPRTQAARILPGLVLLANAAGYLDDGDLDDVTDQQLLNALSDAFVDQYAGYVPEVP